MSGLVYNLAFALGVGIALFGLAVDYVMPGASPGFNIPQLLIVAAGSLLALGALGLRRYGLPRRSTGNWLNLCAQALLVTLVTLLALELLLTALSHPTYYPTELSETPLERAPWWTCDELGCRFVRDVVMSACEDGELRGRSCIVNEQGFADTQDFTYSDDMSRRPRILMLGDSFTQGYAADVGDSFVETLERLLPEALVWNAGIGGTGTNQALATFAGLGPALRPQLTILGFFSNDFQDNLYPLDSKLRSVLDDGTIEVIRYYVLDAAGNPLRLELTASLLEYARAGRLPIPNEFERLVGNTRLGSLLLQLKERIDALNVSSDAHFERAKELTRAYLQSLQQSVAAQGSEFLVLIIPFRPDLTPPKMRYETLIQTLRELDIAYLDPSDVLKAPEDFAPHPDVHWNSAGHQKVGALLSECVEAFIASGDFSGCQYVWAPGRS
ncbi:MAG: GDSL-type esterase/lipase family protein [Chloroflexi bacterium]|nr:GDSL-type esterase/lipase family protein [Chloroflexota bacterium]